MYKIKGWIWKQDFWGGKWSQWNFFNNWADRTQKQGNTWEILHLGWKSDVLTVKYQYLRQSSCATLKSTISFAYQTTSPFWDGDSHPVFFYDILLGLIRNRHATYASVLVFFFHIISHHKKLLQQIKNTLHISWSIHSSNFTSRHLHSNVCPQ